MSTSIEIQPADGPLCARIRPPGSKSLTNRALACAALADGVSTLTGALDSEDTRVMIEGLRSLGIPVEVESAGETLHVHGCRGCPPAKQADVFVANSGTTIRFLTALATLGHGQYRFDGIDRMRERPIGDLIDALRQMGADARCEGTNGCPPVAINASGLRGGEVLIRGNLSSQFLSGLLMAAPCAAEEVTIRLDGPLVSVPYVAMTLRVMRAFGAAISTTSDYRELVVSAGSNYQAGTYVIEPDASAASYFLAAAAVAGGQVTVEGLGRESLQGDVAFADCLAQMGCDVRFEADSITVVGRPLCGIDVDMNAISDTVQTLAVVGLFAEGPTIIRNIGHIRHKETDRIAAVATELRKLGATVTESEDSLVIVPGKTTSAKIDTYNDHRMAMSFALAGLRIPGLVIRDPDCTQKTYPRFFQDLDAVVRNSDG